MHACDEAAGQCGNLAVLTCTSLELMRDLMLNLSEMAPASSWMGVVLPAVSAIVDAERGRGEASNERKGLMGKGCRGERELNGGEGGCTSMCHVNVHQHHAVTSTKKASCDGCIAAAMADYVRISQPPCETAWYSEFSSNRFYHQLIYSAVFH